MSVRLRVSFLFSMCLAACHDGAAPTVTTEPATASTAVATTPAASSVAPSAAGTAKSCLMANVCDCNLGCTSIGMATSDLRDGAKVMAQSGPLRGQTVTVSSVTDAAGQSIFAVSDRGPNMPCMAPADRAPFAYLCASGQSGPVPAKACARGCE